MAVGSGLRLRNVLRVLHALLEAVEPKIKLRRFHDPRHSAASLLIAADVELVEVSMLLGHPPGRGLLHVRELDFGWGVQRIADELGIGHGTVQRVLERTGRNRLPRATRRPVQRYEKSRPGEVLHLALKSLPQLGHRPEFEYAAIDDFSREGLATIAQERSTLAATQFLEHVLAQLPYRVEAVITDNDMMFTMRYAFHSDRLTRFEQALKSAGIAHLLIRPRSPESNGKVERFIKTIDDECYRITHPHSSRARVGVLKLFLDYYNHARPHQSLGGASPVSRRDAYFAQAGA